MFSPDLIQFQDLCLEFLKFSVNTEKLEKNPQILMTKLTGSALIQNSVYGRNIW